MSMNNVDSPCIDFSAPIRIWESDLLLSIIDRKLEVLR